MTITTLSMVLTVYALNLYGISDRPVPPWARTLVTVYIARLVCMRRPCSNEDGDDDGGSGSRSDRDAAGAGAAAADDCRNKYRVVPGAYNSGGGSATSGLGFRSFGGLSFGTNGSLTSSTGALHQHRPSSAVQRVDTVTTYFDYSSPDDSPVHAHLVPLRRSPSTAAGHGDLVDAKQQQQSTSQAGREQGWAKDWRRLAEVMDRLFFWIFLLAVVVTTLLLFHPLTKTHFQPSRLKDELEVLPSTTIQA